MIGIVRRSFLGCLVLCVVAFIVYFNYSPNETLFHLSLTNAFRGNTEANLKKTLPADLQLDTTQGSNGDSKVAVPYDIQTLKEQGNEDITQGREKGENSRSRWVLMGLSVSSGMKLEYAFCIPFVVAAWKRVEWNTTILVFGNITLWKTSPILRLVEQVTLKIDPSTRFTLIPAPFNPVSFAQVGRLFGSLVTPWISPKDIVLTSDIDILPLNRTMYDKVNSTGIFILNADCCGTFNWNGSRISMQPMTSIGMTKQNWGHFMGFKTIQDKENLSEFMNAWLLGNLQMSIVSRDVQKGVNLEWFLDQRVASIQIHNSGMRRHKLYRRHGDRVDRSTIHGWTNFKSHADCHMYLPSYSGVQWENTENLVKDIFDGRIKETLLSFKSDFVRIKSSQ